MSYSSATGKLSLRAYARKGELDNTSFWRRKLGDKAKHHSALRNGVHALLPKTIGEPYTGNLYVRFDEGSGVNPHSYSTVLCGKNLKSFKRPESIK